MRQIITSSPKQLTRELLCSIAAVQPEGECQYSGVFSEPGANFAAKSVFSPYMLLVFTERSHSFEKLET